MNASSQLRLAEVAHFPETIFQKRFYKNNFPKQKKRFSKTMFQKYLYKNGFPEAAFQKRFSKNNCPKTIIKKIKRFSKIVFQKQCSKNGFPKAVLQKRFSKNHIPKTIFQKQFAKNNFQKQSSGLCLHMLRKRAADGQAKKPQKKPKATACPEER